jgi:enoyl-CoA hydratase
MQLNTEKMIGEKEGGVGWMIFNNPARRNAMALEMWSAVEAILDEFESDDAIKVIVMKGAGDKAFVSGADISEFKERRNNAEAAAEYARISEGARARLLAVKKPLIAMIQGYCLGGGMAVAMAADMRFASDDSQFGIPAARLSIAYGFEGLHKLVHLVGPALASEIMFTARRVEPEEAQRIGLINRAVPLDDLESTVREVTDAICRNAPLSITASKYTIGQILTDKEDRDYEEIKRLSKMCFDSNDYKEGREAFMEKRSPAFSGS